MTTDGEDRSTWPRDGQVIRREELLRLIEENGRPQGLDLRGVVFVGDGASDNPLHNPIDLSPEAVRPYVESYTEKQGAEARPPWLSDLGGIDLEGAHLEYADLRYGHLENADLLNAHLENATLDDAHLEYAALLNAHLENAFLSGAQLETATLDGAYVQNAFLSGAYLKNAFLTGAHLEAALLDEACLENADMSWAHLENAHLAYAHLEYADLRYGHLENANLFRARLRGAFLDGCYLERTRMRRESLGQAIGEELGAKGRGGRSSHFHEARETYLALKTNFDSIGRYDDASWAYVKEQQMEKAMHFPTTAGHEWVRKGMGGAVPPPWSGLQRLPGWLWWKVRGAFFHCRLFVGLCPREVREETARRDERGRERDEWLSRWRWARNWAYEMLTGYGERVYMPVVWAIVVVAAFTAIYAGAGNIAAGDVGALQGQPTHSPITALVHSISAFATIGFNTLEPQGWGARLLTAVEAMFGIGLFALFVFTLGNRMRRS